MLRRRLLGWAYVLRRRGSAGTDQIGFRVFPFAAEIDGLGRYRDIFQSGASGQLLGGSPPPGISPNSAWSAAIHPDDRAKHARAYGEMAVERDAIEVEYRLIGFDGEIRWVRDHVKRRQLSDGRIRLEGFTTEVSEAHRVGERLAEAEGTLDAVLNATGTYGYVAELLDDGSLIGSNFTREAFETLVGVPLPPDRTPQEAWIERVVADDRYRAIADRLALRRLEPQRLEYRVQGAGPNASWMVEHMQARVTDHRRVRIDGIITNVTEERALREQLTEALATARRAISEAEARALVDPLTRIANRRRIAETLADELAGVIRPIGLMLIDVDYFKLVNDTFGHRGGDVALAEIASRLQSAMPRPGLVGRWGGEEFCALLPGVEDEEALRMVAEQLRRAVGDRPIALDDTTDHRLTVSVGAVHHSGGAVRVDDLLDAADKALYAAKRRGRNQTRLFGELAGDEVGVHEPDPLRVAQALALSVAVREGTDPLHGHQVADLSTRIAQMLELDAPTVARCLLGGWLHDVGKVAIPDDILKKPGRLSDEQWRVVRNHPLIGEQLIRRIAGLADAAPAIRCHHEHWDGNGYPDGLAGDEIPIEARVIAAANAYAVMTGERVYARGLTREETLSELERLAGSQFDPAVVGALARVLAEDARRTREALGREHPDEDRRAS